MEKMVAYCGLVCTDCEAFQATRNNDNKMRQEIAAKWTKEYNHEFKPEDINCDGCLPDTLKSIGHLNVCAVRKCGMSRGVMNCGLCRDYSCEKTDAFFKLVPQAKKTLDAVKQKSKF